MSVKKYVENFHSFCDKKIVLIGGTTGIGLELLKHLASLKVKIVLLAIEKDLSQKLKDEYNLLDVIHYDQSSFTSIDNAIKLINKNHNDAETFVLNAGVLGLDKMLDNGYQATIGINYIGNRYFIDKISPTLTHSARFVITGSFAAGLRFKKNVDLKSKNISTFDQYNISKAYLEAYFYKLAKERPYHNIEYVLVEPGLTNTGIIKNFNKTVRFLGKYFLKFIFHSPSKASLGLLLGASSKAKNGDYITPRGLFRLSGYPKIRRFPKRRKREYLFK